MVSCALCYLFSFNKHDHLRRPHTGIVSVRRQSFIVAGKHRSFLNVTKQCTHVSTLLTLPGLQ